MAAIIVIAIIAGGGYFYYAHNIFGNLPFAGSNQSQYGNSYTNAIANAIGNANQGSALGQSAAISNVAVSFRPAGGSYSSSDGSYYLIAMPYSLNVSLILTPKVQCISLSLTGCWNATVSVYNSTGSLVAFSGNETLQYYSSIPIQYLTNTQSTYLSVNSPGQYTVNIRVYSRGNGQSPGALLYSQNFTKLVGATAYPFTKSVKVVFTPTAGCSAPVGSYNYSSVYGSTLATIKAACSAWANLTKSSGFSKLSNESYYLSYEPSLNLINTGTADIYGFYKIQGYIGGQLISTLYIDDTWDNAEVNATGYIFGNPFSLLAGSSNKIWYGNVTEGVSFWCKPGTPVAIKVSFVEAEPGSNDIHGAGPQLHNHKWHLRRSGLILRFSSKPKRRATSL